MGFYQNSEISNGNRNIINESIFFDNEFKRSFSEFDDQEVEEKIHNVRFASGESYKEVVEFYTRSGFLYPGKKQLLFDNEVEIESTWNQILKNNDAIKVVFYKEGEKLLGSAMSAQYTDSTWLFQHISVLPEHRLTMIPKLISLANTYFGVKNSQVNNVMIFYQTHTRWAKKSFERFCKEIGDRNEANIYPMSYLFLDLSQAIIPLPPNKHEKICIKKLESKEEMKSVFNLLKKGHEELFLNAYGLNISEYELSKVKQEYAKLELKREREYYIAADENNNPLGFAFCDIASRGISFSNFFDHFQVFIFDREKYSAVISHFLRQIVVFYSRYNRSKLFCLSSDDEVTEILQSMGFVCLKIYHNCIFNNKNDKFNKFFHFLVNNRRIGALPGKGTIENAN